MLSICTAPRDVVRIPGLPNRLANDKAVYSVTCKKRAEESYTHWALKARVAARRQRPCVVHRPVASRILLTRRRSGGKKCTSTCQSLTGCVFAVTDRPSQTTSSVALTRYTRVGCLRYTVAGSSKCASSDLDTAPLLAPCRASATPYRGSLAAPNQPKPAR